MTHAQVTIEPRHTSAARTLARVALGSVLVFAGVSHLTFARKPFQAQVPDVIPLPKDTVVVLSGIVEMSLGAALLILVRQRVAVGWIAAIFFTAIFPGNIAQAVGRRDAFGLDTDAKRIIRLFGQPLLVSTALWSTGALRDSHAEVDAR